MKRLGVILLVLTAFCQVSAQAQSLITHTINRVGKQADSPLPTVDYAHNYTPKICKIQTPAGGMDYPSLEVTMGQTRKEFNADLHDASFEGSIKNISANTVQLNFFRYQMLPSED